ncbi:MAG TPA: MFS transporter [Phenylobacterium sp.]
MTAATAPGTTAKNYRYLVGFILMVVYTFNFLDRQIVAILAEPIRKELGLSDTQLGMLTGLYFALVYTTFGIPVAWLADRTNRVRIVAAACFLWSLFTIGCGMAQNFLTLALSRMGVGIGEAGGSPPSYSLISDYFPPLERGRGLAIYSLGVPLGSMFGAGLGGWIEAHYGWRQAFIAVGAPGVLLALLTLLVVREPKRGGLDPYLDGQTAHEPSPPLLAAVGRFFANRTLVLVALSSGLSAFVGYAVLNWAPSFMRREKGMDAEEIALYYSLVLGIAGVIGTFGAGWLVDRLSRLNARWYAFVPAIAFAVSIPFFIGMLMAPSWPLALVFFAFPALLNNMYLAPALVVVQNAVAPGLRTVTSAILLFILNLIGLGLGPLYVGRISDHFARTPGEGNLLYGLAALVPIIVLTILAHYAASHSIKRDQRLAAVTGEG